MQPKRKAEECRDFKVYAKEAELETQNDNGKCEKIQIEDTSFVHFMTKHIDKTKVVFGSTIADKNKDIHDKGDEMKYILLATVNKDPISYEEAMSSPENDL